MKEQELKCDVMKWNGQSIWVIIWNQEEFGTILKERLLGDWHAI
jgi:hypothetical protein